jgi:hypothetical protein
VVGRYVAFFLFFLSAPWWNGGELKVLEKKGDLSDPSSYRGIMLLEVAMKVIAYTLKVRLVTTSEGPLA